MENLNLCTPDVYKTAPFILLSIHVLKLSSEKQSTNNSLLKRRSHENIDCNEGGVLGCSLILVASVGL
jgi:hypothetical protein